MWTRRVCVTIGMADQRVPLPVRILGGLGARLGELRFGELDRAHHAAVRLVTQIVPARAWSVADPLPVADGFDIAPA